jgi:hypothetical protein
LGLTPKPSSHPQVGAAGGASLRASSDGGTCHRGHVRRGQGWLQLPSALATGHGGARAGKQMGESLRSSWEISIHHYTPIILYNSMIYGLHHSI